MAQRFVDASMEVADPMRGPEKLHNRRKKIIPKKYPKDEPALPGALFGWAESRF